MSGAPSLKILVVDDEPTLRASVAFEIEMLGHTPLEAADGVAALAIVAAQPVHLVVSDVRMPNMDGLQLLTALRAKFGRKPPLAFMSGFADVPIWEAFAKGAQAFLGKPFRPEDLHRVVEKLLKRDEERWAAKRTGATKRSLQAAFPSPAKASAAGGLSVGSGGFFLGQQYEGLRKGDAVDFRLSVGADLGLEGSGVVRWVRPASDPLGGGCGVEFEYLVETSREAVLARAKVSSDPAFIPQR
jgi:CheY-like chemotaxis protein